jgi:uncharacterized protein (DUF433 family)
MSDQKLLERIRMNPCVMAGQPVNNGTRLAVVVILNLLAHEQNAQEIINEYYGLKLEDIQA